MPEVVKIPLELTFPSDWIKMVAMQPHVHLTDNEPFKWPNNKKTEQIAGIDRTLEIAKNIQAHFTLFPECSIPGLDGIRRIDEVIANNGWLNGTIIIGGIDGLSKEEYQQLYTLKNTECHDDNAPDNVQKTEWVNCSVTWVKGDNGNITKYIQPKISPALNESVTSFGSFFRGSKINVYKGNFYRPSSNSCKFNFFSLICFDWIDRSSGDCINEKILQDLNTTLQTLEWVFLLQHNAKPNHPTFLDSTRHFFNNVKYNNVILDHSAVIFANSASDDKPASYTQDNFGCSSIVFHPGANILSNLPKPRPTFCCKRRKYRNLDTCHDIVFREMGACIHSFKIRIPRFLPHNSSGRCLPIEQAYVYPIIDGEYDPRLPSGEVPACIKWINDNLDSLESIGSRNEEVLPNETKTSHEETERILRNLPPNRQQNNIHYATASHSDSTPDKGKDADLWGTQEKEALEHLLHTATIFKIADNRLNFEESNFHAIVTITGKLYEIVAIRGYRHTKCREHFDNVCGIKRSLPILIISRSIDNDKFNKRFVQKITKGGQLSEIPSPKFTEINIFQNGYRELLNIYQESQKNRQKLIEGLRNYVA